MSECSTPQSLCSSSPPISLIPYSSLSFVFSLLSLPFFLPLFPSQFPLFSSGLSCPFPSLLPSVLPSGLTSVPEDLVLAEGATEREGKKQPRGPEPVSEKLERSGGCTFPSTSCLCVFELESLPSLSLGSPLRDCSVIWLHLVSLNSAGCLEGLRPFTVCGLMGMRNRELRGQSRGAGA